MSIPVIFFPLFCLPLAFGVIYALVAKRRMDQGTVLWAMALGVRSGSNLIEDLTAISRGLSRKRRIKTLNLVDRLREGLTLDDALATVPGVVPATARLAIRAGIQNGTLEQSLRDVAVRHTRSTDRNGRPGFSLSQVLIYLTIVPLFATLILSGIMIYIIPKFKAIFDGFDTELPGVTVLLIQSSDWIAKYWYVAGLLIVPVIAVVIIFFFAWFRGFGEFDIPLVGRWFRRLDLPGLLRIFSSAVKEKRPLDDTLKLLSTGHKRSAIRRSLATIVDLTAAGENPWRAMQTQGLITHHESKALQAAQYAGNLSWALEQLADSTERRLLFRWRTWLEFLQPAFVIAIGLGVGFVCIGMFSPLIKLINDLS